MAITEESESTPRLPAPALAAVPPETMNNCPPESPTRSQSASKLHGVDFPQTPPSKNASPHSDAIPSGSPAADLRPISPPASEALEATPAPPSIEESNPPLTLLSATFPPPDSSPAVAAAAPCPVAEMGQMICGGCRQLLAYQQHAPCVQCMCCQTVNLVLEAHQIGNIKCEKCGAFLMYPFGAPAVRCSCCRFVTEITEQNSRPLLSVQQVSPPFIHNHSLSFHVDSPPPGFG